MVLSLHALRGWPRRRLALWVASILLGAAAATAQDREREPQPSPLEAAYARQRTRMVDVQLRAAGIRSEIVLAAMAKIPRHRLVPEEYRHRSYEDGPLPIGHGQTISQPYIVALMTELLDLSPTDRVLEVGTGSGYQAAVLATIVKKVHSIEIYEPLHERTRKNLKELGYENIELRHGDGALGWKEHGPFDAIIVTCAASHIPPPLLEQLAPGGRMCIPVGARFGSQRLLLVRKDPEGKVSTKTITGVRFVPLLSPKEVPRERDEAEKPIR